MLKRSPQLILPPLLTYQEDWIQAYPPSSGKNILSRLAGASQIVHCPQPPRGKSWYGSAFFRLSASRCDRATGDGRPRILTFRLRFGLRKDGRSLGFHGKSLERRGASPPNGIVCGRLNRAMSPLYSTASEVSRQTLLSLCKVYVQPHLDYCAAVYDGHLTVFDHARLEMAQNRAARLITGTPRRTLTEGLLEKLGWATLANRRLINKLILYQKLSYDDSVQSYIKGILPNTRTDDTGRELRHKQKNIHLLYDRRELPAVLCHSYLTQQDSGMKCRPAYEQLLPNFNSESTC